MKKKIIKSINNEKGYLKTSGTRKLKRLESARRNQAGPSTSNNRITKHHKKQASPSAVASNDGADRLPENAAVAVIDDKDFQQRRLFVKKNCTLRTDEILKALPFYLEFPKVIYNPPLTLLIC